MKLRLKITSCFLSKRLLVTLVALCCVFSNNYAQSKNDYKLKTVVIDAGHGGHDPGCLGSFAQEKDVALSIALGLGDYIKENFKDVTVKYTRDNDVFIPLHKRADIANQIKADLFISIHANSAQNKAAKGTETYVMGTKYVDRNMEVVKRENAVILLEDDHEQHYDGLDPKNPESSIIFSLFQSEYLKQSISLAEKVQTQFEKRVERHNRGVKQRVLFVMYKTFMPSVLIEAGFLTNLEDEKYLKSKRGVKQMSAAIYRAFMQYKYEAEGMSTDSIKMLEYETFKKQNAEIELSLKMDSINVAEVDSTKAVIEEPQTEKLKMKEKIETSNVVVENVEEVKKKDVVENSDLVFKIQLTSSSKKIEVNSHKFKGLEGVEEYEKDGIYKYTFGKYTDIESATNKQKQVREVGFADAFVIAFYKGERVSMKRAREILKGQ